MPPLSPRRSDVAFNRTPPRREGATWASIPLARSRPRTPVGSRRRDRASMVRRPVSRASPLSGNGVAERRSPPLPVAEKEICPGDNLHGGSRRPHQVGVRIDIMHVDVFAKAGGIVGRVRHVRQESAEHALSAVRRTMRWCPSAPPTRSRGPCRTRTMARVSSRKASAGL